MSTSRLARRLALAMALLFAASTHLACSKKDKSSASTRKVKKKVEAEADDGDSAITVNPDGSYVTKMTNPGEGLEFGVARTALARPKMADRFYASSLLLSVFGPEGAPVVVPLIQNNMAAFGGPCDLLGRLDGNYCAGKSSFSQLNLIPTSLATREGARLRTCETLTYNDATLKYAIGQLEGASINDTPNATAVGKVYEAFYPGQQPTTAVKDALLDVAREAADSRAPLDGWRFLFLTVCSSPDWQLL